MADSTTSPPLLPQPYTFEGVKDEVWQHLYDAARLVRYYAYLSDKYRLGNTIVRFFLYFSATSGVVSFTGELSYDWQLGFGIILAVTITVDFVFDMGKKASALHSISVHCGLLESDWEKLLADIMTTEMTISEIITKDKELSHSLVLVTSTVGFLDISENHKLNDRCADEAADYLRSRYATAQ